MKGERSVRAAAQDVLIPALPGPTPDEQALSRKEHIAGPGVMENRRAETASHPSQLMPLRDDRKAGVRRICTPPYAPPVYDSLFPNPTWSLL